MCRLAKIMICILLVSAVMCGCVPFSDIDSAHSEVASEEENETENEVDLISVGFSQLGSESRWRIANTKSIESELTRSKGFDLIMSNARQRQDNQIKDIRSFISQGVDYIVFSPVTEKGWETVLGEAKEAGIPVILVDRKISTNDDTLYTTWVGSDARREGEKAGEWLEGYLARKRFPDYEDINIVVLQGTTGSSAQIGRTMGFDSISDKHQNWHILEQQSADFTTAKAKEVMSYFLDKYEDIDVVVCQNDDMAFGAITTLKEAGFKTGEDGDIVLISFDAVNAALELVEAGEINVDIECNPLEGEYISDIIRKLENGEPVERSYVVDEQVFTKSNVSEVLADRAY